jgi:hypothetical protein
VVDLAPRGERGRQCRNIEAQRHINTPTLFYFITIT